MAQQAIDLKVSDVVMRTPLAMMQAVVPSTRRPRHIHLINAALCAVAQRKIKRLIIAMPPRHGKSQITSVAFPAWYLAVNPSHEIIQTSSEFDLAQNFTGKARELFIESKAFHGHAIERGAQSASSNWRIEKRHGGLYAAGVGGMITGRGAHGLIIDDPIKNSEEAASQRQRDKIYDWYWTTARPRIEPNGFVILIMTRWHEDDLAGRLIAESQEHGEPFEVLSLPAIAEDGDALGRAPGEALWPERYSRAMLDTMRSAMPSHHWNALYQQRPTDEEGAIFKRQNFSYYDDAAFDIDGEQCYKIGERYIPKKDIRVFQVVDTALKAGDYDRDYTVIGTFGVTPDESLIVMDIMRDRLEVPDQTAAIKAAYDKWPRARYIAIEDRQSGTGAIQQLVRDGYPIKPIQATINKRLRATASDVKIKIGNDVVQNSAPAASMYQQGKVFHLRGASWLDAFEDELLAFDHGRHDDQVDVVAYACICLQAKMFKRTRFHGALGGAR